MGQFLENAWYVAGWSDELGDTPLARKLLDQPVVMFRQEDGSAVALADRCPHRFVPLSAGTVEGDAIQCPYHGLRFSADGRCHDRRVNDLNRERFRLRNYPIVERYGSLWIWMGDAERADLAAIPDFSFLAADTHIVAGKGTTYLNANYMLEVDNLLDLSHLDFVHRNTISNGLVVSGEYDVRQAASSVHSDWMIRNTPAPRQFADLIMMSDDPRWDGVKAGKGGGTDGQLGAVDHWLDMHWHAPGSLALDVGVAAPGIERANRIDMMQAHYVTPETATTTHYFWIYTMTRLNQPQELLDGFLKVVRIAFDEEDKPMLDLQQRSMGTDFWGEQPMILEEDAGAIRARRILDKLIREEQAGDASTLRSVAAE